MLLRPLPYAEPGRLAMLWTDDPARRLHREPTAALTVEDWRRDLSFENTLAAIRALDETPERSA